jgi:hypothetical protein
VRQIALLIPTRTDEYFIRLWSSLNRREPGWEERCVMVLGDNGLAMHYGHPGVLQVELPPEPFVFAKAINACAAAVSPEHDLMVLNDDTTFESDQPITTLQRILERERAIGKVGLISPRITGGCGNPDQQALVPLGRMLLTNIALCFIGVAIPRETWDKVGPLDERFIEYGCDDVDYALRVQEVGLELGVTSDVVLHHHGLDASTPMHGTFGKVHGMERLGDMAQRARAMLVDKWRAKGVELTIGTQERV